MMYKSMEGCLDKGKKDESCIEKVKEEYSGSKMKEFKGMCESYV